MEVDLNLELQAKDLFKDVIWDGNVEQIAIWLDGDWSVTATPHFEERIQNDAPIQVLNLQEVFSKIAFSFESIEQLIMGIEDKLNGRESIDM